MARVSKIDENDNEVSKTLARSFQSAHVNFLIGSGASYPAIPTAGNIEQEIKDLIDNDRKDEAKQKTYEFLVSIQEPMNKLIGREDDDNNAQTLKHYQSFLGIIETILSERRTSILPKQATIFTTNYDLFFEEASGTYPALRLNDGFNRVPRLDSRIEYSSRTFFNITSNTGNKYDYKVDIPCVNLIKLHGSLSWSKDGGDILFNVIKKERLLPTSSPVDVEDYIETYAVVLPQTTKFRTTLMERNYYELLRIYANELDKENVLLVAFGFSFGDEHIFDITKKALKNPTLKLVIFAFSESDCDSFMTKFDGHNNVEIISPPTGERIDFQKFNEILRDRLPRKEEA